MTTRDGTGLSVEELFLLWAARETGALETLMRSAGTPTALADRTGITDRAARVTVEALADMGFVREVGDEYEPTNRALGFLATRDPRSVGRVPLALDLLECYVDLPETMRTGDPPTKPADWTDHRVGAHAAADEATVRACVTAALRASPDADTVVDLCGGSGVYAAEFAARGLDATLVDSADVVEQVRPMLAGSGVACEARRPAELEGEYDLAVAVDVGWSLSAAENRRLVEAAADALAAGGSLVLVEPLAGRSDASTETAIRALATTHGTCHEEDELRDWCLSAGLGDVRVSDVPGTPFQAVAATREQT